jgi:hypothetical protein
MPSILGGSEVIVIDVKRIRSVLKQTEESVLFDKI